MKAILSFFDFLAIFLCFFFFLFHFCFDLPQEAVCYESVSFHFLIFWSFF